MIKKIEINEGKSLKETNIRIDCGLLKSYCKNEFFKKLAELVEEYEKFEKEE